MNGSLQLLNIIRAHWVKAVLLFIYVVSEILHSFSSDGPRVLDCAYRLCPEKDDG